MMIAELITKYLETNPKKENLIELVSNLIDELYEINTRSIDQLADKQIIIEQLQTNYHDLYTRFERCDKYNSYLKQKVDELESKLNEQKNQRLH